MSSNKRKNILMLALVFCCCLLSVGYLTLISTAVIEGNIKLEPAKWNICFKNIKTIKTVGDARNYMKPKLNPHYISFYVDFKEIGDSITYNIDIANEGNIDAKLASINLYSDNIDYIKYEYYDIDENEVLKSGEKTNIRLKVTYSEISEKINEDKMMLVLNWKQA